MGGAVEVGLLGPVCPLRDHGTDPPPSQVATISARILSQLADRARIVGQISRSFRVTRDSSA
jgi:hypothetical protein